MNHQDHRAYHTDMHQDDDELARAKQHLVESAEAGIKPFYVRLLEVRIAGRRMWFLNATIVAFGPYVIWALGVWVTGHTVLLRTAWYTLYAPTIILAGLSLLHHAYYLLVEPRNLRNLVDAACDRTGLAAFESSLRQMFVSRGQVVFLFILVGAGVSQAIAFGPLWPEALLELPSPLVIWMLAYVGYAAVLVGPGVWLAATSTLWVHSYTSPFFQQLRRLYPHRHAGLRTLAAIIGTYSLSFSLETSLALSVFYAIEWQEVSFIVQIVRNAWVCVFVPLIIAYFIYPQYRIGRLIFESKQALMANVEEKIDHLYFQTNEHDVDTIERILKYDELLRKLQAARTHVWDMSVLYRFISAALLPVIVFAIHNPDGLQRIWSYFRRLTGY